MSRPQTRKPNRSRLFVLPGLQARIMVWFGCVALATLLFQFLQFNNALTDALSTPVEDVSDLHRRLTDGYLEVLVQSIWIGLPLIVGIGMVATFRVAGPLHRIQSYLRAVRDGETAAECSLRNGDELGELCELVNEVTRPQREANAGAERQAA